MPEDRAEDNPETKTDEASDSNRQRRFKISKTVRIYLEGIIAGGLEIYGAALLNSHPKPLLLAWGCIWFGAWFSADVIRLWLVNHKSKHRMPNWLPNWVFVGVVSVASAGCLFAVLYENERPKTFAVSAPVIIGSPSREVLPEYWLVTQEAAYAAPLAMQLEFANLKPISSMVSAYSIETKIGRKWVTMPCLDVRRGNVFWVPGHVDFVHAKLIDFRPMFNDLIQNKNLQPGDTAKGWLLISIPKEGWNPKSLQCRIKYSSGEEAVEPVIGPDPGGFDTDLRGGAIIAGPTKDISTIPKKYREDRYSPS